MKEKLLKQYIDKLYEEYFRKLSEKHKELFENLNRLNIFDFYYKYLYEIKHLIELDKGKKFCLFLFNFDEIFRNLQKQYNGTVAKFLCKKYIKYLKGGENIKHLTEIEKEVFNKIDEVIDRILNFKINQKEELNGRT